MSNQSKGKPNNELQRRKSRELSPVKEKVEDAAEIYYDFCRKAARAITRFKRRREEQREE